MNDKQPRRLDRRSFIKNTSAGAAVLGAGPTLLIPRFFDPGEGGFEYTPHISPFRVVGVHDSEMTREEKPTAPWRVQDKLVQDDIVGENIDRLACALSEEKKIAHAWKKIFMKPAGKSWSDVVVAVKTNNIARQHTRSAVMAKMCRVLVEVMKVKPSHVFIYDACHGGDMLKKTPFKGLPEGCSISSQWGGYNMEVPLGRPWFEGKRKAKCLDHLVKNKVDILINIALCKGHSTRYGAFTMCMKNHLGTFNPRPHAHEDGCTDYLFSINKSPLILGEFDEAKKKVVRPMQQLCLIDALWASEGGPACDSSAQPNRLFMGVFAPTLDFRIAHRFRKETMGWSINDSVTDRFLTEFGFEPSDFPKDGDIKDAKEAV